ncbi:Spermidine/putrescine import ATP-binding protein PotA [compost metagenome]
MENRLRIDLFKRFSGFELEARLEFDPGITALVGPSGSGKTTLLRCLAGLERPERGHIQLGEETWLHADRGLCVPVQRRRVGFVFNDYALFPEMTVLQNVLFGARRKDVAQEWLELLDIAAMRDRLPRHLSAGQQQRVALARALASEPRLLLLDEPFSSLDPHLKVRIYAEFLNLIQRLPIPIVMVTHDMAEASLLASAMVVLSDGRILQADSPSQVLLRPSVPEVARLAGYRNVFESLGDGRVGLAFGAHHLEHLHLPSEGPFGWCVRSDRIEVVSAADPRVNVLPAEVLAIRLTDAGCRMRLMVIGAEELEVLLPVAHDGAKGLQVGDRLSVRVPPEAIHRFPRSAN